MAYLFEPTPQSTLAIGVQAALPLHRNFCVGRNYAVHAVEMGSEVDRAAPF